MYRIVVVDRTAESRNRIVQAIEKTLRQGAEEFNFIPQVSLKPLALEEIKFHAAPDVCIVGDEIVEQDLSQVQNIRALYPSTTLMVRVPARGNNLSAIEQLARCGADDLIVDEISSRAFLQKLVLLSQRKAKPHQGTLLLVTSGKGGVGVTSVAAGLAEVLVDAGKRVALVDLDFETQDLSRFLRVRPYLNENLQLLLDESAVVTEESVQAAIVPVWADEPNLEFMPPMPETPLLYEQAGRVARSMISVFEQLDVLFDCVVVDAGSMRGPMLEMLYRVADRVLYVMPKDPAALFASIDRLRRHRQFMGESAKLSLLVNETTRGGLKTALLCDEFNSAAGVDPQAWVPREIPFSSEAQRWPASGASMAALGGAAVRQALQAAAESLNLIEGDEAAIVRGSALRSGLDMARSLVEGLRTAFTRRLDTSATPPTAALPAPPEKLLLPEPTPALSAPLGVSAGEHPASTVEPVSSNTAQAGRRLISGATLS